MRRTIPRYQVRRAICVLLALLFLVSAAVTSTLAWQSVSQQALNPAAGAPERTAEGDLIVEKEVRNADGTDLTDEQRAEEFSFTIRFFYAGEELTGQDFNMRITGPGAGEDTYGVVPNGGVFRLRHGQRAVFFGLQAGITYLVTETVPPGFTLESSNHQGTIVADREQIARFVNIWGAEEDGEIIISKTVENHDGSDLTDEQLAQQFTFTITLDPWVGDYIDILVGNATQRIAVEDGVFTITLRHNESATLFGLAPGVRYHVAEGDYTAYGYVSVPGFYAGYTIIGTVELPFVNIYRAPDDGDGDLEIGKTVVNADGSAPTDEQRAVAFAFTVTFGNVPQEPAIILLEGEEVELSRENDMFAFTLRHGETVLFENIPAGVTYRVEEHMTDGFTAAITVVEGTAVAGRRIVIPFVNQADPEATLIVRKEVAGTGADPGVLFHFIVEVEGLASITFSIRGGEYHVISGLPVGATFVVREVDVPDGFTLVGVTNGTGTLTVDAITSVFRNEYEAPRPLPSPSPTISPSPSPSPHPTPTASPSPTPTASPHPTPTASPAPTPTASPHPTPTASPAPTPTASPHPTPTASPAPTPTASPGAGDPGQPGQPGPPGDDGGKDGGDLPENRPDVPDTSDPATVARWAGLSILSLMGLGGTVFFAVKHKEEYSPKYSAER